MQATEKWGMAPDQVLSEAAKVVYAQSLFWFWAQLIILGCVQAAFVVTMVLGIRALRNPELARGDEEAWQFCVGAALVLWLILSITLLSFAGDALGGIVAPELRVIQNSLPSA